MDRLWTVVTCALLGASCCRWDSIVDTIPPHSLTATRLTVTQHRIHRYWTAQGRMPAQPTDLPDEPNRDCSLLDGWGRPFHWQSEGQQVTVWSLGRDGQPGGTGDNEDIEVVFAGQPEPPFPAVRRRAAP